MSAAEGVGQATERDNVFRRTVSNLRAQRDFARRHWAASLVYAAAVAIGGWVLADLYDAWKPWQDSNDKQLVRIREEQAAAFKQLDEQLGKLGRTVDGDGKEALREVEGLVRDIRETNTGLLHQLVLAREEYDRLSQVSGAQRGVSGGYDFILGENTGMNVDASTVVGVGDITDSGAYVRVSADGTDGRSKLLGSGEFVAYRNADGEPCRVTVLSVNRNAAASFDVSCEQG